MTPRTALATEYGPVQADDILATLRKAGYIVVVKDAIRLAQVAAREEAANDNERGYYPPPPADWDNKRAA